MYFTHRSQNIKRPFDRRSSVENTCELLLRRGTYLHLHGK